MNSSIISERELKIIDEVSRDKNLTQRKISRNSGLSLGMTNLILKRLASKGYIKVKGLDRRKVQYILTPKGFTEKAKKSYRYFLKTIHSLKEMKKKIQELVLIEYEKGKTYFIILGAGELADIIELSLKGLNKRELKYRRVSKLEDINSSNTVVLLAQSEIEIGHIITNLGSRAMFPDPGLKTNRYIDVLSAISGSNELI